MGMSPVHLRPTNIVERAGDSFLGRFTGSRTFVRRVWTSNEEDFEQTSSLGGPHGSYVRQSDNARAGRGNFGRAGPGGSWYSDGHVRRSGTSGDRGADRVSIARFLYAP